MKDKILQLAVECGLSMSKEERQEKLVEEFHELLQELIHDERFRKQHTNVDRKQQLKNEFADLYITLILAIESHGLDVEDIVADKIEEVRSRYTSTINED